MHRSRRLEFGVISTAAPALVLALMAAAVALAEDLEPIKKDSGFAWIDGDDTIPHEVPRKRVKKGVRKPGHPRDIIKPIDAPRFYPSVEAAETALGLGPTDRVLGLVIDGEARAYPTRVLDQHEVANDTIKGRPLAVIW